MAGGIYCIENIINGKKYIGQSVNINARKSSHFSKLNKRVNHNIHLQRAFDKYGKENFSFNILIYCESFELTRYEQFFVDFYAPEKLYNICLECVNSSLGVKYSQESKIRISKNNSGKNNPMFGKRHSEETKIKMSQKAIGKNNHNFKTHPSEETRKKMSEAHKIDWKNRKLNKENK